MEFVLRCVGFVVVVGLNAGARIVNLACPFNSLRCTDFGGYCTFFVDIVLGHFDDSMALVLHIQLLQIFTHWG